MHEAGITNAISVPNGATLGSNNLEYLDNSFARIAKKDDIKTYMQYMLEYHTIYSTNKNIWSHMCKAAQDRARALFLIELSITRFETYILDVLNEPNIK